MDISLLDAQFNPILIIDQHISVNWAVRFKDVGEVDLTVPLTYEYFTNLVPDRYLAIDESDRFMIIETVDKNTTVSDGSILTITGRTLESILDRRIIKGTETVKGPFEDAILGLVRSNCIDTDSARKIPGFTVKPSNDQAINAITIEEEDCKNQELLSTVQSLCDRYGVGFRILPIDGGGFEFSLYSGVDRSWTAQDHSPVIFSTDYENLVSINYLNSTSTYKNTAYVEYSLPDTGEEGGGSETAETIVSLNGATGLARRETQISVSGTEGINTAALAQQEGKKQLADSVELEAMDAEMENSGQFVYGRDYYLGDIVQVIDELGVEFKCRVSEVVLSEDSSGFYTVPTFECV